MRGNTKFVTALIFVSVLLNYAAFATEVQATVFHEADLQYSNDAGELTSGYALGKILSIGKDNISVDTGKEIPLKLVIAPCSKMDKLQAGDRVFVSYKVLTLSDNYKLTTIAFAVKADEKQVISIDKNGTTSNPLPKMYSDQNLKAAENKFISSIRSNVCK